MEASIPTSIQPLLAAYLHALEPLYAHIHGIYIYGSISLGAFEEQSSDIDIITLTQGEWSGDELRQLRILHQRLLKEYPLGKRLEIFYVPSCYLGITQTDERYATLKPYPEVHDGKFLPATRGGLNAVTWWIIKHHGLQLLGPAPSTLPLTLEWQDILTTMRFNLDIYYGRQLKRSYLYLNNIAFEFAVSNLCRILSTIEDSEIVAKSAALKIWRDRLPERWQPLLDEAWRIRHHIKQPSFYRHRIQRMNETVAFIEYGRQRGCKALDSARDEQ